MFLVQLLLPVYDNSGRPLLASTYEAIRSELIAKFGGLTAFTQTPAEGFWTDNDQRTSKDQIIVVEVMSPTLDEAWWDGYREMLEAKLMQESVVIRSMKIRLL